MDKCSWCLQLRNDKETNGQMHTDATKSIVEMHRSKQSKQNGFSGW